MPVPCPPDDITALDAEALSNAIRTRSLSCREVMQATLRRIDALNPRFNAIVNLAPHEQLLRQADERDAELARGRWRGWMHGMPQAIKDAAHAAGFPTTFGSPLLRAAVAAEDGVMAARMKAAGCIVIGKTNMPEFGLGSHTFNEVFGATRNAWDDGRQRRWLERRRRGGPGAAPAAGGRRLRLHGLAAQPRRMEPRLRIEAEPGPRAAVAGRRRLGQPVVDRRTDGTQRHRPGAATRHPVRPRRARTAVAGRRGRPRGLRCNGHRSRGAARPARRLARRPWRPPGARARPAARVRAGATAHGRRRRAGRADRAELRPAEVWSAWLVWRRALVAPRVALHLQRSADARQRIKPEALWEHDQAAGTSVLDFMRAAELRTQFLQRMLALFETFDVLALPATQVWPFAIGQRWPQCIGERVMDTYHRWMECTLYATFAGLPAASVPAGFHDNGRWPAGLQLIGRPRGDAALLRVLAAYEQVSGALLARAPWASAAGRAAHFGAHLDHARRATARGRGPRRGTGRAAGAGEDDDDAAAPAEPARGA